MKPIFAVVFAAFIVQFACPVFAFTALKASRITAAPTAHEGKVSYSNISVKINGYPIPSYNIAGKFYVAVEDLKHYGMDVEYLYNTQHTIDGAAFFVSGLTVAYNPGKKITPLPVHTTGGQTYYDKIKIDGYRFDGAYININSNFLDDYTDTFLAPMDISLKVSPFGSVYTNLTYLTGGRIIIPLASLDIYGKIVYNAPAETISLTFNPNLPISKTTGLVVPSFQGENGTVYRSRLITEYIKRYYREFKYDTSLSDNNSLIVITDNVVDWVDPAKMTITLRGTDTAEEGKPWYAEWLLFSKQLTGDLDLVLPNVKKEVKLIKSPN